MSETVAKLSAHNLKKRYKTRTVVEDVSFELRAGEVVGLLGPNGAGKTTCFYMIVGLVAADGGEALEGVVIGNDAGNLDIQFFRLPACQQIVKAMLLLGHEHDNALLYGAIVDRPGHR